MANSLSPEQGVDTLTPQDRANKINNTLRVLNSLEYQTKRYSEEVRQMVGELEEAGKLFSVKLDYPVPEADAHISFDGEVVEEKPLVFVATTLCDIDNGEALFANDETGHILKISGGYYFEISPVGAEINRGISPDTLEQLGKTCVKSTEADLVKEPLTRDDQCSSVNHNQLYRGGSVADWGAFYGFEAIKDTPYSPERRVFVIGKDENGSDRTLSAEETMRLYLQHSTLAQRGGEFVNAVVADGARRLNAFFDVVKEKEAKGESWTLADFSPPEL